MKATTTRKTGGLILTLKRSFFSHPAKSGTLGGTEFLAKILKWNIPVGSSIIRNPILVSYAAKGMLPYRGLGSGIKRALEAWPEIDFVDNRGCSPKGCKKFGEKFGENVGENSGRIATGWEFDHS